MAGHQGTREARARLQKMKQKIGEIQQYTYFGLNTLKVLQCSSAYYVSFLSPPLQSNKHQRRARSSWPEH